MSAWEPANCTACGQSISAVEAESLRRHLAPLLCLVCRRPDLGRDADLERDLLRETRDEEEVTP